MKIRTGVFFLAALLLASCNVIPPASVPDLNFANVAPLSLDVGRIDVREDYAPPMRAPNVDHLFRQPPVVVLRDLVGHMLVAGGGRNELRVMIEDASVVSRKLPVSTDIFSTLKPQPVERYEAKISLRFESFDPQAPDIVIGRASVTARRSTTLMSDYSLADRDRAAFDLTERLMSEVAESLRTTVGNTFGRK